MFETMLLLMIAFPLASALCVASRGLLAERRACAAAVGGAWELVAAPTTSKPAAHRTTKWDLVVEGWTERMIDSSRRCAASARDMVEQEKVSRGVQVLELADARRAAKRALRSAAARKGWETRRAQAAA